MNNTNKFPGPYREIQSLHFPVYTVPVFSLYFIELDAWLYALTNIFIQVTFW